MNETASLWYNYQTDDYDALFKAPVTDEETVKYIPQIVPAQGLYNAFRAQGHSVLESMGRVLAECVGEEWPE